MNPSLSWIPWGRTWCVANLGCANFLQHYSCSTLGIIGCTYTVDVLWKETKERSILIEVFLQLFHGAFFSPPKALRKRGSVGVLLPSFATRATKWRVWEWEAINFVRNYCPNLQILHLVKEGTSKMKEIGGLRLTRITKAEEKPESWVY